MGKKIRDFYYKILTILKDIKEKKALERNKKAKLGIIYNLFDAEELLEKSILQIRDYADYIVVGYQNESWYGNKDSNNNTIELLNNLKNKKFIDDYYIYDYKNNKNKFLRSAGICRRLKMLHGVKLLKKNKCSHVLFMDVDEFYFGADFKIAKEFIIGNNFSHSAVPMYGYYYKPIYRRADINQATVPFILKIKKFKFISSFGMPCYCDTYRCFNYNKLFDSFYFYTKIAMHHMTRVRKNINEKFIFSDMYGKDNRYSKEKNDYLNIINNIRNMNDNEIISSFSKLVNSPFIKVNDYFNLLDLNING